MNTEVFCNECGKFLFLSETASLGGRGVEAQSKGFVYKNAALFSDKYTSLYFCSDSCAKEFYGKHIPRNPEITAELTKLKEKIPEMSKDVANKMGHLMERINKLKR